MVNYWKISSKPLLYAVSKRSDPHTHTHARAHYPNFFVPNPPQLTNHDNLLSIENRFKFGFMSMLINHLYGVPLVVFFFCYHNRCTFYPSQSQSRRSGASGAPWFSISNGRSGWWMCARDRKRHVCRRATLPSFNLPPETKLGTAF